MITNVLVSLCLNNMFANNRESPTIHRKILFRQIDSEKIHFALRKLTLLKYNNIITTDIASKNCKTVFYSNNRYCKEPIVNKTKTISVLQ